MAVGLRMRTVSTWGWVLEKSLEAVAQAGVGNTAMTVVGRPPGSLPQVTSPCPVVILMELVQMISEPGDTETVAEAKGKEGSWGWGGGGRLVLGYTGMRVEQGSYWGA